MPKRRPVRSLRNYSFRSFGPERLESRSMLAVTTSLVGGELTITGDGDNDVIAIVGTANPGELTITGSDGTSVDGTANGSVTIGGVTGDLIVDLGAGDDRVTLNRVYVAGNITVNTGDGADRVTLGDTNPVSPAQDLTIDTGLGNDEIFADNANVYVGLRLWMLAGEGDDTVRVDGASSLGIFDLNGNEGNDSIGVANYTSASWIRMFGDAGADQVSLQRSSAEMVIANLGQPPSATLGIVENLVVDTVLSHTEINVVGSGSGDVSSMTIIHCKCTQLEVMNGVGDNFIRIDSNAINGEPFLSGPSLEQPRLDILDRTVLPGAVSYVLVQYNLTSDARLLFNDGDDNLALVGNTVTNHIFAISRRGMDTLFLQDNTFGTSSFVEYGLGL